MACRCAQPFWVRSTPACIVLLTVDNCTSILPLIFSYARVNPRLLGASIDHVRTNVVMNYAIYSDACTTIGAGSYCLVADVNEHSPDHMLRGEPIESDLIVSDHVMRCSTTEFAAFEEFNVNTNVLELFAMILRL